MKAYTKDIMKTIVKGKKRFLALMLITALGVCMQCGLKAACDDLRISADRFFDEQNLFDISIVSTMGLTQEDVDVLSKISGIEDAEGAYSETVFTTVDGKTKQAEVRTLSEKDINMPYLLDGEMPMRADEILVTNQYLSQSGKSIGDKLLIEEKTSHKEEQPNEEETEEATSDKRFELELQKSYTQEAAADKNTNMDISMETSIEASIEAEEEVQEPNFLFTEYTIVGVVVDVLDVNSSEGAVSFRSTSTTDYTFFVRQEAVSSEIYTAVYLTLADTDALLCYSQEYEAQVKEIVTLLEEEIKADRENARFEAVTGEALEKVEEAESEIYEQFAEAEEQILDAKAEIENGWKELLSGEKELLSGEEEIAAAERKLQKAQRELERGQRELDDAQQELEAAWEELESGELLLTIRDTALSELEKALAETEKQLEETEAGILEQFVPMRTSLETQIAYSKENLTAVKQACEEIEAEKLLLQEEAAELEAKEADGTISIIERLRLSAVRSEIAQKEWQLESRRIEQSALEYQLQLQEASLNELDQQEAQAYQQLETARKQFTEESGKVQESRLELTQNQQELETGRAQLTQAQEEFNLAKQELASGWDALESGWEELEQAYLTLADGKVEFEEGQEAFADGKQQYEDSVSEYQEKRQEALEQLADAREEIANLKMTEWYITTRSGLSGFSNVKTDAQCIESIGNAFPILFLTVAILISLTTISRMVEEDRGLIGTYKALGFTDKEIRKKYILYALSACLFGGVLGDFLGFVVLPKIIFTVFAVMYDLPVYDLSFDFCSGMAAILLFVAGIAGAAIVSCNAALSHMPAVLMRPKAPKNGSRVFLERITPIWSRLSFLNKVTARNLFRYKKRLCMTLFGIAGCTSILLAGYTIKDTITEMMPLQYEKTMLYDLMVIADDAEKMMEYIEQDSAIRAYIHPMISNLKISNEQGQEETVQLIVLSEGESLRGYINLYDKQDNVLRLEDGEVFTTINVANVLGYGKGDTVTMQTLQLDTAEVEVTNIVMNYLGNYVYMTQATYEEYFGAFEANGILALLNGSQEGHEAYAEELAAKDGILSALAISSFGLDFDTAFQVIDLVVMIVIVLAAALAFVVLFTLSTTNISERERELATIKVLGFFDHEVHLYVNKETILLTGLGILLGMPLGKAFGVWLMSILQMPSIYFAARLYPISYLIAAVMSITFALLVNFITDRSLDKIHPVEALKSIE